MTTTAKTTLWTAVFAAITSAAPAPAQEMIRFASGQSNDSILTQRLYGVWMEQVNADAAGEIRLQNFPPPFAEGTNMWDRVGLGAADIGVALLNAGTAPLPLAGLTSLPSAEINDPQAASIAFQQTYEDGLLDSNLDDVKILALFTTMPTRIYGTGPIQGREDLVGAKIRAADRNVTAVGEALGATPLAIPFAEVYQALSKNVVDTAFANGHSLVIYRQSDFLRHGVENISFGMTPVALIMNRDRYDSLPEAARVAIDKHSGQAFSSFAGGVEAQLQQEWLTKLVGDGALEMHQLAPDELAAWTEISDAVIAGWRDATEGGGAAYDAFAGHYADAVEAQD